ncbi:MAG: hypothetical protein LUD72_03340 [Bacteroidales bacterium]|nr:hypothetical protein [Bacteroidales bacterium]
MSEPPCGNFAIGEVATVGSNLEKGNFAIGEVATVGSNLEKGNFAIIVLADFQTVTFEIAKFAA